MGLNLLELFCALSFFCLILFDLSPQVLIFFSILNAGLDDLLVIFETKSPLHFFYVGTRNMMWVKLSLKVAFLIVMDFDRFLHFFLK
jgi:hypothetical protein